MTRSDSRAAIFLALGVLLTVTRTHAAGRDEAGARTLFAEGRKLVDDGNYPDACPKFEESLRLDPGTGTSFNLADCLEHIGRTASAWARFLDVAAASKAAGQPEREQIARVRAEKLEPTLSRLVIQVATRTRGLVVERDGVVVGAASWGVAVPVDPGEHRLRATADGRRPWEDTTSVPPGPGTVVLSIPVLENLPPEPHPAPAAKPAPTPAARDAEPTSRISVPVVALAAVSAAGLATTVIFGLQARSENAKALALCPGSSCATAGEKTEHDGLAGDARRDRTVSYVGAGIAGAALVAAVYLWWAPFDGPKAKQPTLQAALRPLLRPPVAGLEVAW